MRNLELLKTSTDWLLLDLEETNDVIANAKPDEDISELVDYNISLREELKARRVYIGEY